MSNIHTPLSTGALQQLSQAIQDGDPIRYYQILIDNVVDYGNLGIAAASDGSSGYDFLDFAVQS